MHNDELIEEEQIQTITYIPLDCLYLHCYTM